MRFPILVAALFVLACGGTNTPIKSVTAGGALVKPARPKIVSTKDPERVSPNLGISPDIIAVCDIRVGDVTSAPKFDFDEHALLPEDKAILDRVAECMTHGPLSGQSIQLVGRADPRGTVEYNFVLGSRRAQEVADYLVQRGVDAGRLSETSRGELDASGTDEEGWRIDRRVDLMRR